MTPFKLAISDIQKAASQYRIWLQLGLLEVKQRYRRSVLGPWWISLSMLIFILAMGNIFSRLLAQSLAEYIPFFTAGFLLWSFISTSINESTDIFKSNSGFIKQVNLPYNLYILKFLVRNFITLAHNFVVYLLVIGFFRLNPGWASLLAIPGMILLILNLYWICLIVALISVRYRDMVQVIQTGLQILFFMTPISWMPKLLGEESILVKMNPFVYFLDAIRQPLLGNLPSLNTWIVNSSIAIIGLSGSLLIFSSVRSRIPFWVD